MERHFNGLTPAEAERLALLIEECGEVIQAATKVLRHGYESINPLTFQSSPTNREALVKELGHVEHAISRMVNATDIWPSQLIVAREQKATTIGRWLHHQDTPDAPA